MPPLLGSNSYAAPIPQHAAPDIDTLKRIRWTHRCPSCAIRRCMRLRRTGEPGSRPAFPLSVPF
jgi:hypothetical protein